MVIYAKKIRLILIRNGEIHMEWVVRKLPIPIVGLMLALAATGNLVLSYGVLYRNIFGMLSAIILILVLIKIIKYPIETSDSLNTPVVASVFPTLSMGIMILATYVKPFASSLSLGIWLIGLVFHGALIISFTRKYVFNFNIKAVFPSWFIVYVGIVVGSVTAPTFDKLNIGQLLFWFGFISYLVLLPIIVKRIFKYKEIPEPVLPTITILCAPASLCLAGYISSFPDKNILIVSFLLVISQLTLLYVLSQLPKLLKLKFYPSYSGFTFPLVITAISLKLTYGFLNSVGKPIDILKHLVKFEEILAVIIVLYVLFRYIRFLFTKAETAK